MKSFTVVFISNVHLDEEDSSDFKEWRDVVAKDAKGAMKQFEGKALVVSCTENK